MNGKWASNNVVWTLFLKMLLQASQAYICAAIRAWKQPPLALLLVGLEKPSRSDAIAALVSATHASEHADLTMFCKVPTLYMVFTTRLCCILQQSAHRRSERTQLPHMLIQISSANRLVAILTLAKHPWAIIA